MLAIVVPARDEAENLSSLLDEIHAALASIEHEVIVVDDGSADGTPELLRWLRRADPRLRALRHRVPSGQSAALRSGIRAARSPWIATLDGDGQNDPADLPRLWSARPPGLRPDQPWLAIGHRVRRCDGAWRRFCSQFAFRMRAWRLGDPTPDTGCGTRLFGRAAYLDLPWFDHQHRFLPALFRRAGGAVASIPVNHRPRAHGRSKYGTWRRAWEGMTDLRGVRWLQRRNRLPEVEELA
jgi:dolichol-phosphate mannosyltransferase